MGFKHGDTVILSVPHPYFPGDILFLVIDKTLMPGTPWGKLYELAGIPFSKRDEIWVQPLFIAGVDNSGEPLYQSGIDFIRQSQLKLYQPFGVNHAFNTARDNLPEHPGQGVRGRVVQ